MDLAIGYDPLVPSDSVGMFLFFMFITNVMLPASLPLCAAMSLLAAVGHIVITSSFATQNKEYFGRQVSKYKFSNSESFKNRGRRTRKLISCGKFILLMSKQPNGPLEK